MAGGILVFVEQRNGQVRKSSLEALGEARRQANRLSKQVIAVIAGSGIDEAVKVVAKRQPDKISVSDASDFAQYSTEGYAAVLACAVKDEQPDFVFASHTSMAKDLIPRVAARCNAACVADVVELKEEDGKLCAIRPIYAGRAYAVVELDSTPAFLTLRPNLFPESESVESSSANIVKMNVVPDKVRARVVETHAASGTKVELSEARIVVSGGRGIKGPENWSLLQNLCDTLGAALGASRAVVDAGWIDHQYQVGQTGKTVSPQLYIACGISGAIQHLAGMSSSKVIVAINKDKEAPIFKHATYGVTGDIFEFLPKFTEECRKLTSNN